MCLLLGVRNCTSNSWSRDSESHHPTTTPHSFTPCFAHVLSERRPHTSSDAATLRPNSRRRDPNTRCRDPAPIHRPAHTASHYISISLNALLGRSAAAHVTNSITDPKPERSDRVVLHVMMTPTQQLPSPQPLSPQVQTRTQSVSVEGSLRSLRHLLLKPLARTRPRMPLLWSVKSPSLCFDHITALNSPKCMVQPAASQDVDPAAQRDEIANKLRNAAMAHDKEALVAAIAEVSSWRGDAEPGASSPFVCIILGTIRRRQLGFLTRHRSESGTSLALSKHNKPRGNAEFLKLMRLDFRL